MAAETVKLQSSIIDLFDHYQMLSRTYDEYFLTSGCSHTNLMDLIKAIGQCPLGELNKRHDIARQIFREKGITFKSSANEEDGLFPFDLLPRLITEAEWGPIQKGLIQRVQAINAFLADIYGSQRILKDKIIPEDLVKTSQEYYPTLCGIKPPGGVHVIIEGCDLIRNENGEFYVLEDNLRVPSGVSYLLENRRVMQELWPEWLQHCSVHDVNNYAEQLKASLASLAPFSNSKEPFIVLLTPGPYNSAYFEHQYLAKGIGCPLVENAELFVADKKVYWQSPEGPKQVDVLYKRTDDQFIDASVFKKDSLLGITGLVDAYQAGNIVLANALGNGVADDKAIYHFVPRMIRYYLGEDILLPQVPTYLGAKPEDYQYIMSHLDQLVVKVVNQSGGYGMLIGPQASKAEIAAFKARIKSNPRSYIAQPLMELSTMPSLTKDHILKPHRVDLRVYVLTGKAGTWVLPGALTRVALKEKSYIVNSSQGGGSKDTWIIRSIQP